MQVKVTHHLTYIYLRNLTSSEDSNSDSPLERCAKLEFVSTGGGGGGSGAGAEGGRGGVGSAARKGAGIFILFIKCNTYQETCNT